MIDAALACKRRAIPPIKRKKAASVRMIPSAQGRRIFECILRMVGRATSASKSEMKIWMENALVAFKMARNRMAVKKASKIKMRLG